MMGLSALLLVQALTSLAPTIENVRTLPPAHELVMPEVEWPASEWSESRVGAVALIPASARVQQAVQLSDGYYTRLDIHRYAGYAVLPLFLVEYLAGQKLLEEGSGAPLWAEKVHKPAAYAVAGIFTLNTVTGIWNLAAASKVKQGKNRRAWHSILMLAADAGFVYSIAKAPSTAKIDARIESGKRGGWTPHKASAIASMGVATISYLMTFVWKSTD
jgi:hypothetical protein